jgi:fatty acid desaturase
MPSLTPQFAERPFDRDYSPPRELAGAIREMHHTVLGRTLAAVAADHAAIAALIAATLATGWALGLPAAVPVAIVALTGIARFQRALECMVHEASHHNWDRAHRDLNDRLANLLAAFPVFGSVHAYRTGHLLHHRRLGTSDDPDLRRYIELDIEALDRTSALRFGAGVLVQLPRYFLGWWQATRTSLGTALKSLCWHFLVVIVPVALIAGPRTALFAWSLWIAAFVLVLPVIRFIGEAGEHHYLGTTSMIEATITNDGWIHRALIHPHNDGYHLVHHLWPGVPHHKLRKLHHMLLAADPDGFGRRYPRRTRILEEPVTHRQVTTAQPGGEKHSPVTATRPGRRWAGAHSK